jgi:hypothetical protein
MRTFHANSSKPPSSHVIISNKVAKIKFVAFPEVEMTAVTAEGKTAEKSGCCLFAWGIN